MTRARNPKGQHLPGLPAKAQREYEDILKSARKSGRYKGREKEVAARTVKKQYSAKKRKKNKTVIKAKRVVVLNKTRKKAAKRKRNIEQGFYDATGFHPIRASSDYSEGRPASRSKKAKARKTKAKSTASHRRKVASRKATTKHLAGRSLSRTTSTGKRLKRRNIAEGFYDASGIFHPIRAAADYSRARAGETGRKAQTTRSKKRATAKRKASSTARHRSKVASRKAQTKRLAGRAISKSAGLLKRSRKNPAPSVLAVVNRTSPKAQANRKEFAGEYRKDTPLYFPEGTPGGLSKIGKLLQIKTKQVVVKPHAQTWLCRDTQGRLHLGTTSKDGVIWSGPKQDFGKVMQVDYEDVKKHLGYSKPQGFYHFMGEEDGNRPTLCADGKGGLKFKGGNYRFTSRGIEN